MRSEVIPKRLLNEEEASYYLGISKHTLRKQRSDGQRENHMPVVPYIKQGRSVKYLKEDIDDYIEKLKENRSRGKCCIENNGWVSPMMSESRTTLDGVS